MESTPTTAQGLSGQPRGSGEQPREELERLRERVAALEAELVEVQTSANAAVAKWQERAYWLDRLHIDLNRAMQRPGAEQLRLLLKSARTVYWRLKLVKRRLSGQ
jgi:hypothetical protein